MIEFDNTFGWGEILSLVAIIISGVALWRVYHQNQPEITIKRFEPMQVVNYEAQREDRIYSGFPLILTNTGGRSASLLQLLRSDVPPVFVLEDGASFKRDTDLDLDYAVADTVYNSNKALAEAIISADFRNLNFPQVLNLSIDSGESRPVTFFIRITSKSGRDIENSHIAFSSLLHFSDGTTFNLKQAFGYDG